jgi:hypothetical protein
MGDFHELRLEFRRVWAPVQTGSGVGVLGGSASGRYGSATDRSSRSYSANPSGSNSAVGTPNQTRTVSAFTGQGQGGARLGSASVDAEGGLSPGVRFCHVGVIYESAFYIFGGYDGTQR